MSNFATSSVTFGSHKRRTLEPRQGVHTWPKRAGFERGSVALWDCGMLVSLYLCRAARRSATTSGFSAAKSCCSKGSFTTSNNHIPPVSNVELKKVHGSVRHSAATSGAGMIGKPLPGGGTHPVGQKGADVSGVTFNGMVLDWTSLHRGPQKLELTLVTCPGDAYSLTCPTRSLKLPRR